MNHLRSRAPETFACLPIDSLMEMCGPFVLLSWAVFLAFIYCPPGLEKMLQCGCHASLGHCSWPHCVHLCSCPQSPTKHVESDCRQASLHRSDSGPVSLSSSSLSQARFAWKFYKHCFSFDLQRVKHETCEVSGAAQIISGSRAVSCGNERFVTAQVLAWVTLRTFS